MDQTEPLIRNISDTARWVAIYRARETERSDAVFRDPFARRLGGQRGEQIAKLMPLGSDNGWSVVARTYSIDKLITEQIAEGIEMVVNLAAGLDSRPYRMALPSSLQWIEIDLPEILDYKEEILRDEKPVCSLERIRLDLSNATARLQLLEALGRQANKVLAITEGLLIYLDREQVANLAWDLAAPPSFCSWIAEVASPGLLKMLDKRMKPELKMTAPFKFGPEEGTKFFEPFGWQEAENHSLLKTAGKLHRLPLYLKLMSLIPEKPGPQGPHPWSGVCLFRKKSPAS
jgi:methyltransferase (TIGR00027 family)